MIDDRSMGRLEEIKEFAESRGILEKLEFELNYLHNYGQQETRCLLFTDFAPHSLAFTMQVKNRNGEWERWFNGGLIFRETEEGGEWSVNT